MDEQLTSRVPTRCLLARPRCDSVYFAGKAINLSAIARFYPSGAQLRQDYLSRIFKGFRQPRTIIGRRIAFALGMSFEAFADELAKLSPPRSRRKNRQKAQ